MLKRRKIKPAVGGKCEMPGSTTAKAYEAFCMAMKSSLKIALVKNGKLLNCSISEPTTA